MNVFIDTNILFEDYFFEKKMNKKILDYAKSGLIYLFISDIVKLELRRQFIKELEEKNRDLTKVIKDANRLLINSSYVLISIEEQLKKFDDFYEQLDFEDNIEFISYKNEFLPDIVDRAIYRKKPFSENKTELKDALIWKSYANHVEKNQLKDCILLTNNTSDFCDKNDKALIHRELQKDTDKFTVINSSHNFIKEKAQILESPEHKFQSYIDQLRIDSEFVSDLISENFDELIEESVHSKIQTLNPSEIIQKDYWFDGYISGFDIEIVECSDISVEIFGEKALISGRLSVTCDTESYQYNPDRDHGEDKFTFLDDNFLTFDLSFNFDLKESESYSEFEITEIELVDVS